MSESKSLDVLGAKPLAEAICHLLKGVVEGVGAFLSRICLPAAEEFGLLLQDKVRAWRSKNAVAVMAIAESRYERFQSGQLRHAPPRRGLRAGHTKTAADAAGPPPSIVVEI